MRPQGCPSGGLRPHVPAVVSRQLVSHMRLTHARAATNDCSKSITNLDKASQRITGHHRASHDTSTSRSRRPTRGSKPESERTHKSREKRDKKSKVPRKRGRILTFPWKSTEEERTRIRTLISLRTNLRTSIELAQG